MNLKQLAQELKLSTATVSRALSGHVSISPTTQARVRALAHAWHYTPNFCASGLRRAKTYTIGLVIPAADIQHFALAIDGIEEVACQHKCYVLLYLSREDCQREQAMMQLLASGLADGLLLAASPNEIHLELLVGQSLPVVRLNGAACCDGREAARVLFQKITAPAFSASLPGMWE